MSAKSTSGRAGQAPHQASVQATVAQGRPWIGRCPPAADGLIAHRQGGRSPCSSRRRVGSWSTSKRVEAAAAERPADPTGSRRWRAALRASRVRAAGASEQPRPSVNFGKRIARAPRPSRSATRSSSRSPGSSTIPTSRRGEQRLALGPEAGGRDEEGGIGQGGVVDEDTAVQHEAGLAEHVLHGVRLLRERRPKGRGGCRIRSWCGRASCPARGSSPGATRLVQGRQLIEG